MGGHGSFVVSFTDNLTMLVSAAMTNSIQLEELSKNLGDLPLVLSVRNLSFYRYIRGTENTI